MDTPSPDYCLFWINHWSTCMTKAEWSGWIQAFGSITAIVAAALAVWWQVRKARITTIEFQHDENVRILCLIAVANLGCISALKQAKGVLDENVLQRTLDGFAGHCLALAAIPLLEIPNPWVAMAIGRAVQERGRLLAKIERVKGTQMATAAVNQSLEEFLECECVIGVALAELDEKLPYDRVEINDKLLHRAPTNFSI